jgi:enoyl-[acyl-carrier-protein] reductase (NADH)
MADTESAVKKTDANNDETMLKRISEIKELMEKNAALATVVESEPKRVLAKSYVEGSPANLKSLISSLIGSYSYDSKGNAVGDRELAVTIMIEDITPAKTK